MLEGPGIGQKYIQERTNNPVQVKLAKVTRRAVCVAPTGPHSRDTLKAKPAHRTKDWPRMRAKPNGSSGGCRVLSVMPLCLLWACGSSGSAGTPGGVDAGADSTSGLPTDAAPDAAPEDVSTVDGVDGAAPDSSPGDGSTREAAMGADAAAGEGGTASGGDAGLQAYKGVALYEVNTCPDIATLGLSWYYNWTVSTGCTTAVPFVPQIWGHASEPIATEIAKMVSAGHQTVLGFNEPDNASQSNMTVATAVSLWPELTTKGPAQVGSPATAANTAGQAWFQQFMTQVAQQKLRVDFIALHWYGWNAGACNDASTLESYLTWAEQWKLPLWLTEWGCMNDSDPTAATVKTFYNDAIAMFKKHPLLQRYAWYLSRSSDNDALVSSTTGLLSPLGTDYLAAPAGR
jgi:hypothetical protein